MSSRSSQKKERYGNSSKLSRDNYNEGTAARTRPFSFDEIMLRRKSKTLAGDVKEEIEEAANKYRKDDLENVSGFFDSDTGCRNNKDFLPGAVKGASEDLMRLSTRTKEEKTPIKVDNSAKIKHKESRDWENKLKVKQNEDVINKAKSGKIDKWVHARRKNEERSTEDFEGESQKKRSWNTVGKNRYDRSRGNSERESKRRHRNGDDEENSDRNVLTKHDPGKWKNSEFLERKERRESPPSRYEESRLKRRRSKSREHGKDRRRRSISLSPGTHKRTSYHGREHVSSHTPKERSGRQHADVEKSKISSNGSSGGHYRRHGVSSSGLGGYSPRKRRSEAAIKTPSPTKHSPEKKNLRWDFPPAGADSTFSGTIVSNLLSSDQNILSSANELPSVVPLTSIPVKPVSGASLDVISAKKSASVDTIQLTQATRPLRRIYIENVPASASEKDLMECLNNFLLSSGDTHILGTQPCISCIIHKEKGHAFLEFLTPEDASAALYFDGKSFCGSVLKIRRPKDFVQVATGVPEKFMVAADAISDIVVDSSHKIFIGGISGVLSSGMLMEIAGAFGPLKAYRFLVNGNLSGPCAFLEYVDPAVTFKACAGLNGMKLGGQILTAVQAFPHGSPMENTGSPPFYGIPEHAKPLLEKPTQVLKLRNVFNPEDFLSLPKAEVEEVLEDIRVECARFGTVKSVNVVEYINNTAATPEKSEVADALGSAATFQDAGCGANNVPMESKEEDIDHDSGEISMVEPDPSKNFEEPEGLDRDAEGISCRVDRMAKNFLVNELCELSLINDKMADDDGSRPGNCDATFQDTPSQLDVNPDRLECLDSKALDIIGMKDLGMEKRGGSTEEELNVEEVNGRPLGASACDVGASLKIETDAIDKDDNEEQVCDTGDLFEPGCIIVEYKRTEDSCLAAHCLHGRVFDDRIVTVGYVTLDLYQARFPR